MSSNVHFSGRLHLYRRWPRTDSILQCTTRLSCPDTGLSLIPLAPEHAHALHDFVDASMWAGMAASQPRTAGELAALFEARISDPASLAFAVADERTGAMLGTTALNAIDAGQQRVEVGGTFFGRQFWGSHVNPASKQRDVQRRLEPFAQQGDGAGEHAETRPGCPAGHTGAALYTRRTFAAL
jgi:RimJ/RimL family protein N-acetyltransferase